MANRYVSSIAGQLTEVEAKTTSAGVADAGKIIALNAQGDLDASMMPPGIVADVAPLPATENISAGDYVNIYDASGTASIRLADGSAVGKEAHGYVLDAVTSGNTGTVYFEGTNNQVTGQTVGRVFLSATTPGKTTSTAPTAAGHIVQRLGVAYSATEINTEISQSLLLV